MSSQAHEILILGGNFGGISSAHYLLRHTIPALTAKDPNQKYRVTIVSPSTHSFFKIAAPRVLISSEKIPLDKAFQSIRDGFATYQPSQFSFLQGKATAVDPQSKMVTVSLSDGGSSRLLPYSTLVIATGNIADPLWALNEAHTHSQDAHRQLQAALPGAKSILIAGGGPAGVETAGEIAENYPHAKAIILSGGERLLPRLNPKTSHAAAAKLQKLNVTVIHGVKVVSAVKENNGQTRVNLSNGADKVVDVYINATGGRPNTDFLPHEWLDERGKVLTDAQTLRGTGSTMDGVYCIGDAGSYSSGGVMDVQFGTRPLCTSIGVDITAQISSKEKLGSSAKAPKALLQVKYKPMKDSQLVVISSNGGVVQILGWRLPSFLVWLIKSRDFMIGNAEQLVKGANYVKP
ncbi:hypothetical protein MMC10_003614 [Thelotrema lepadinum]|nr:hypothetical protein [Thelotrema lepadinum]